jgi:DNA-binding MarR family transcriptional regulator
MEVAPRLRVAVLRLARHLRQQAEGDVTPSTLSALSTIERRGPLTLGELAAIENVQPPTMTRIVGRLEEFGYVERQVDPNDRRVARATATAAGKEYAARARDRYNAYLAARIRQLPAADRKTLAAALPVLERLLEEVEADT